MNAINQKPIIKTVIAQINNNTTSWIGHHKFDNKDIVGGQTFVATSEEDLEAIEVLPTAVATPGNVLMTLHNYDVQLKSWGPVLGSANVDFNHADNGKWKSFKLPGLHLVKGKAYGFRLEGQNAYIGMGEAAGSAQIPPLNNGEEWQFTNNDEKGNSFSYFSLAFKIDVRA